MASRACYGPHRRPCLYFSPNLRVLACACAVARARINTHMLRMICKQKCPPRAHARKPEGSEHARTFVRTRARDPIARIRRARSNHARARATQSRAFGARDPITRAVPERTPDASGTTGYAARKARIDEPSQPFDPVYGCLRLGREGERHESTRKARIDEPSRPSRRGGRDPPPARKTQIDEPKGTNRRAERHESTSRKARIGQVAEAAMRGIQPPAPGRA